MSHSISVINASVTGVTIVPGDDVVLNLAVSGPHTDYDFSAYVTRPEPSKWRLGMRVNIGGLPYGLYNKQRNRYEMAIRVEAIEEIEAV
jgi:hypothetical protein